MLFRRVFPKQHSGRRFVSFTPLVPVNSSSFLFLWADRPAALSSLGTRSSDASLRWAKVFPGKSATVWALGGMAGTMVSAEIAVTIVLFAKEVSSLVSTGTCYTCKKGWNQMCDKQVINGETKPGGCK